jgi:amidohydrolase
MEMKDRIFELSKDISPTLVKIRRHIHKNPELAFNEFETTIYLKSLLEKANIETRTDYAETGVVGLLEGNRRNPVVALRGDIDALPLEEKTGLPFASKKLGVMHACGHDSHAAVTIGAAIILSKLKDELEGSVKFILQPAEEKNPGGAVGMVKKGVLKDPVVDVIWGLHSDPNFRAGEIAYLEGPVMAQPDEFYITIKGKGGHAAKPHETIDPIVIAAEVVLALQKIPSRLVNPIDKLVVTVGKIAGGHINNVIPDSVEIVGTVRTFKHELAIRVEKLMRQIVSGITSAYGAGFDLLYDFGYPVVINEKSATQFLISAASEYLGPGKAIELEQPSFGGEDFGYYLQEVNGSFFRLGTGNPEKGITANWHNSKYTVDEDALSVGAGLYAYLAYKYLKDHN